MFTLISDETSHTMGIEVHKKREYEIKTAFLCGSVTHDSTKRTFAVQIAPNYDTFAEIGSKDSLKAEFNESRSFHIDMGKYKSLDIVDASIRSLENWYRDVLMKNGANQRFLILAGNDYHFVEDNKASPLRYGEAIIRARNVQAFNMMRQNKNLDYETIVGKIMPIFLHSLGLKEYHLTHDLNKDGNGEAKFIIDKVGVFAFYKPQKENGPAYFERLSYRNGNYHRSFAGEAKGDIVKKFIFEWLVDAARESNVALREDYEAHLDELSRDVHRAWIKKEEPAPQSLILPKIEILRPTGILSMAEYRQH